MYNNVGGKIKGIASVCGWISLIAGAITWIILIANGRKSDNIWGWVALIYGVASFLSSWVIYGFGQLVEDIRTICEKTEEQKIDYTQADTKIIQNGGWKCSCGRVNAHYVSSCSCGKNKSGN